MSLQLTNLRYSKYQNKLYAKFYGDNSLREVKFKYSLYCKAGEFKNSSLYSVEPSNKRYFFDNELVDKIVLNTENFKLFDNSSKELKSKLYLSDLSPEYQFLVYNKVKFSKEYTVAYLDIETRDSLDTENTPAEVLMVTILYRDDDKYRIKMFSLKDFSSEENMLNCAMKFLTHTLWPDMILGWNVINYDKKYLMNRCKLLGVKYDWDRFSMIEFVDGMEIIVKKYGYGVMKETGGMKLDNVAKHYLGRGKIPFKGSFGKLYDNDYDLAVKYNVRDLMLVKDLDVKKKLIQFLINLQGISGCLIRDTFYNSVIIDMMILNRYPNYVFPSRQSNQLEEIEEYEGGYVISPPSGVFDNVAAVDVSSMYPSIILTFNVSPDSKKLDGDVNIDGVKFDTTKSSIFKETIRELYDNRLNLKGELKKLVKDSDEYDNLDSVQLAYKSVLNSVYGVMAFRWFRMYDVDIAKSITYVGRNLLKYVGDRINTSDCGVILYGDTDSLFFTTKRDPDECLTIINDVFIPDYVKSFNGVNVTNCISMEMSKVYKKMALYGKKKVYICQIDEDKFHMRGGALERYDTPKIFRPLMKEIIKNLFNDKAVDLKEYYDKICEMKKNDFLMLKKMNKTENDYKVIPQQLKAARFSNKVLKLNIDHNQYSIIKLLYVKSNKHNVNIIALDEDIDLPSDFEINVDRYFAQFFLNNLQDLYSAFNFKGLTNTHFLFEKYDFSDKFKKKFSETTDEKKKFDMLIKQCIKLTEVKEISTEDEKVSVE